MPSPLRDLHVHCSRLGPWSRGLLLSLILWGGVIPVVHADTPPLAHVHRFVVYYADSAPIERFDPFDLLVLDSHSHPPLRALADRGKTLLGYLSLGEVASNRAYFNQVREENILLGENPNWSGSHFVDVRDPRWTARVIEELIPDILRQGFHGLFLDTLDNPPHLERTDPKRYEGMSEAAARLVRAIRRHYPRILLVVNRGYEILPAVAAHLQGVLGESVRSDYDFANKRYQWVDEETYRSQVNLLQKLHQGYPHLPIFTLDYRDPGDVEGIRRSYREQRANGFIPYVATVELDRIVPEPKE